MNGSCHSLRDPQISVRFFDHVVEVDAGVINITAQYVASGLFCDFVVHVR